MHDNDAVMTPEEFERKMLDVGDGDPERSHLAADELMMELLCLLGYEAGVKVFDAKDRWYA